MNIIKTYQTLSSQPPDKRKWHSTVVVPFNNFKEITSQDLKHHDEMLAIRSVVDERLQQLSAMGRLGDDAKPIDP